MTPYVVEPAGDLRGSPVMHGAHRLLGRTIVAQCGIRWPRPSPYCHGSASTHEGVLGEAKRIGARLCTRCFEA